MTLTERYRLLADYAALLERGDLDALALVLDEAEADERLAHLLAWVHHDYLAADPGGLMNKTPEEDERTDRAWQGIMGQVFGEVPPRSFTLETFLRAHGHGEFRLVSSQAESGEVTCYVHPFDRDGETLDLDVRGNDLRTRHPIPGT